MIYVLFITDLRPITSTVIVYEYVADHKALLLNFCKTRYQYKRLIAAYKMQLLLIGRTNVTRGERIICEEHYKLLHSGRRKRTTVHLMIHSSI